MWGGTRGLGVGQAVGPTISGGEGDKGGGQREREKGRERDGGSAGTATERMFVLVALPPLRSARAAAPFRACVCARLCLSV